MHTHPTRSPLRKQARILLGVLMLTGIPTRGQEPSIDELGEGLDLSILDEPSPTPTAESMVPALHLFSGFTKAPEVPRPDLEPGIQLLQLPATATLVVPNAPRIDRAYQDLGEVVRSEQLETAFPLKIVLHADGNVSVGCGLKARVEASLPPGIDVSPQEGTRILAIPADVQIADRTHPPVVRAVVALRQAGEQHKLDLDLSEIYFLPLEPGRVVVGLRIQ